MAEVRRDLVRLERMGLRLGAAGLEPKRPRARRPLQEVIGGSVLENEEGRVLLVESRHPTGSAHGRVPLARTPDLAAATIARLGRDPALGSMDPEHFAFIDTETTGLAGGAGTYVFLVGVGFFQGEEFRVRQYFMRDFNEEKALLAGLEELLSGFSAVISFNGKAFDLPLIQTRYVLARRRFPLSQAPHWDLLHSARRLWGLHLESCSLGSLENHVLGFHRTDDVPSFLVPSIYFDYLRFGATGRLQGVFHHNLLDILSLAALSARMCALLEDPLADGDHAPAELLGIGRLFLSHGDAKQAAALLERAIDDGLPPALHAAALRELSFIHKRDDEWEVAERLWRQASDSEPGRLYPLVELAKYYEHRSKDLARAEEATRRAIAVVERSRRDGTWTSRRMAELEHRLVRLLRKRER
ncbi:MAG: ribonuclease H-like domain-containing protein, partial [Anaerolineae bacterium]